MSAGGHPGKLIDIDLTAHRVRVIPMPPEDIQRTWIGGLGLGLYFLASEITPTMKTTDPEAPCFVMTGPLTGTDAPSSADWGAFGGIPVKNFTEPESAAAWCNSLKNDLEKWNVEAVGSWQCEMACHHLTTVTTGPLAGSVASGFGAEVFEEVGPNMGIYDAGTSMALAGFVDGLGIHSGEIPRAIATMMEAYNAGRLTLEDTDGIDLTWGNYESVIAMLQKAVRREGIGALIAQGMEATSQQLGIEDLAVHMRGVGFQGHDFRFHPAAVFAKQVVTGIGPSPQTTTDLYKLSSDEVLPRDGEHGIGQPMLLDQCKKLWIDSIGVCTRAFEQRPGTLECAVAAMASLKGWSDFTREEALTAGERIVNLQRLISLSRGFTAESDFHMNERMLSVPSGPARDKALPLGPFLRKWRDEYYQAAGWNTEDGKPLPETLERLGLSEFKVGKQ